MGDIRDDDWPGDDTDWARLYFLSPNLWSDYLDEIEDALDADRAQPADLVQFIERCLQAVRCLSDIHARLPRLGLTLERFVALRETAVKAELAAVNRDASELGETQTVVVERYWARRRPVDAGPLSDELKALIVNLSLRGLEDARIACALDIHGSWPAMVRNRARLHAGARKVVVAHLAGRTLAEIAKETGVPATSALRILKMIDEKPNPVMNRVEARARARAIVKLRVEQRLEYKEIAEQLGCSMDTVKNALRPERRRRYGPAS